MAVYCKFKSEKNHNTIFFDGGDLITVGDLKDRIFYSRYPKTWGRDLDLEISNAQTNEVYEDNAMLIRKYTSVLVRRIPQPPRIRYVPRSEESKIISILDDPLPVKSADVSVVKDTEDSALEDEFGEDIYVPFTKETPVRDDPAPSKDEEDSKIKCLIETPALGCQSQADKGYGPGRGRMMAGHGFGQAGLEYNTPPQGYVCHRCSEPGHFIQHCPTNGNPDYDIKKTRPSTGFAITKPNEGTFEAETGRIPTSRSRGDLHPELLCPLCKDVMKFASLTSTCCFDSFCDKCIRDHIISKSICVCGAKVLADDLIPNKTLRGTINHILESKTNSSSDQAGSSFKFQDTESALTPQPKIESPTTQSATSKGEDAPLVPVKETPQVAATQAKKKKKKAATDMRCGTPQKFPAERLMMPKYPSAHEYNPYCIGIQPAMYWPFPGAVLNELDKSEAGINWQGAFQKRLNHFPLDNAPVLRLFSPWPLSCETEGILGMIIELSSPSKSL